MKIKGIESAFARLADTLSGGLSRPGESGYVEANATWAKQVGYSPLAVAHCGTAADVQQAVTTARDCEIPLSVRGGGHDWAGRALCDGLVIDLRGMRAVSIVDRAYAKVSGGALGSDVVAAADPLGLVAVTGAYGGVGMAGLALGGGYGPLIGTFGLAADNIEAAEVVLADGRVVQASPRSEPDLFWALRGGGGNFGVVTSLHLRLHRLPSVCSGILAYPLSEARSILRRCAELAFVAPHSLSLQVGFAHAPDGAPITLVVPTWSGAPGQGEAFAAPFMKLGTLLMGSVETTSFRQALAAYDAFIMSGQRVVIENVCVPALDGQAIDMMVEAATAAVSTGCMMFTHELIGAAAQPPSDAMAFGHRHHHTLIEIVATWNGDASGEDEQAHRRWAHASRERFGPIALPGAYANLLAPDEDFARIAASYNGNAARLAEVKRRYDPTNLFRSAIPLPPASAAAEISRPQSRQAR